MLPINIRLPAEMIDALRLQAKQHGLEFSAHVRSQLAAAVVKPANILSTAKGISR